MPRKSRSTGNTTTDPGYNSSGSQTKSNTQSSSSSRKCKRLFDTFTFFVFKTSHALFLLLFQRMTRAALFYDEEGRQVSISLQGDHLNLSRCFLQYYWLLRHFLRKRDSPVNQLKWDVLTGENKSHLVNVTETARPRVIISAVGLASTLLSVRFIRLGALQIHPSTPSNMPPKSRLQPGPTKDAEYKRKVVNETVQRSNQQQQSK